MESNTPRSRLGPAVVLLLLATLLLVTADSAGARRWDGPLGPAWEPGQWAGGSRAVQIGQPVYTGDVRLCVTRRATAVLEDIEPAQRFGEFRMDEKFMRPPAMTVDTTEPTVADRDFAGNVIDRPCDGQSPLPSVGFRLTRLTAGHAGFDGLILTYRVNAVPYRYLYRFSFGLCDPAYDGGIGLIGVCGSGPESAEAAADSPLTGPIRPLVLDPMAETASRTAPIGSPAVFETGTLCLSRGGTAVIDRIEPRTLGRVHIDRIGIRAASAPEPEPTGLQPPAGLDQRYRPAAESPAVGACSSPDTIVVGVQASRTGPGDARIRGLDIAYHVGQRSYRFRTNASLTLCDPDPTNLRLAGCDGS